MKDFIKAYVSDILWAFTITLLEIAVIAGCLFVLTLLPHGLTWLSLGYFQCFIIICVYRLVTYRMVKNEISQEPSNNPMAPSFNTIYSEPEPENMTRPMRNVYSAEETDALNHESEFSVRE